MPRSARLVIPEVPYHITQRGNNRTQTFFYDPDYKTYLELLREYSRQAGLTILGYCLMPNHVHLLGVPGNQAALAQAVGHTHSRYVQLFNLRHQRGGHLWQERFFSCALDEAQLVVAMRYVECNPVRAGLMQLAWEYTWSSAVAHVGRGDFFGLLDLARWSKHWSPAAWREFLLESEEEQQLVALRQCTHAGKPCGDREFLDKLERMRRRSP